MCLPNGAAPGCARVTSGHSRTVSAWQNNPIASEQVSGVYEHTRIFATRSAA
jgi:hypothetical protein